MSSWGSGVSITGCTVSCTAVSTSIGHVFCTLSWVCPGFDGFLQLCACCVKEIKYIPAAVKSLCSWIVADSMEPVIPTVYCIFLNYYHVSVFVEAQFSTLIPCVFRIWHGQPAELSTTRGLEVFPSSCLQVIYNKKSRPSVNPCGALLSLLLLPEQDPCTQNHRHCLSEPLICLCRNIPHTHRMWSFKQTHVSVSAPVLIFVSAFNSVLGMRKNKLGAESTTAVVFCFL